MGLFDNLKGINVASAFKLQSNKPLDLRLQVETIADRDLLVTENGAYEGMVVYVTADSTLYVLKDAATSDWEVVGRDVAADLADLQSDVAAIDTRVTTAETKLSGIATGANKTVVDSALSSSSTNPVQNKVVNTALSGKVPAARKINGKALSADITLSATDVSAIPASQKGAASGVAALDADGYIPVDRIVKSVSSADSVIEQGWYTIASIDIGMAIYYSVPMRVTRIKDDDSQGYVYQEIYIQDKSYTRSASFNGDDDETWEDVTFTNVEWTLKPTSGSGSYFGICETEYDVAEKVLTIPGITELYDGLRITVYFKAILKSPDTLDTTLNVNGLGAVSVKYNASDLEWSGSSGCDLQLIDPVISFVYVDKTDGNWSSVDMPVWQVDAPEWVSKAGNITGQIATANIADGAVTAEKLADDLAEKMDTIDAISASVADLQSKTKIANVERAGIIKPANNEDGDNISGLSINQDDGNTYVNTNPNFGTTRTDKGKVAIYRATSDEMFEGADTYKPVTPKTISGLVRYSETPVKVGVWIDGTPVWRQAFSKLPITFQEENAEDTYPYYYTSEKLISATDFNKVHLLNSAITVGSDSECIVDSSLFCGHTSTEYASLDFSGGGSIRYYSKSKTDFDVSGWVEFITPESNISVTLETDAVTITDNDTETAAGSMAINIDGGTAVSADEQNISGGTADTIDDTSYESGSSMT